MTPGGVSTRNALEDCDHAHHGSMVAAWYYYRLPSHYCCLSWSAFCITRIHRILGCPWEEDNRQTGSRSRSNPKDHNSQTNVDSTKTRRNGNKIAIKLASPVSERYTMPTTSSIFSPVMPSRMWLDRRLRQNRSMGGCQHILRASLTWTLSCTSRSEPMV